MGSNHAVIRPEETIRVTTKPIVTFSGIDVTQGSEMTPSPDMKSLKTSNRNWSPPRNANNSNADTILPDAQSPEAFSHEKVLNDELSNKVQHSSNHKEVNLQETSQHVNEVTKSNLITTSILVPSLVKDLGTSSPENRRLSRGDKTKSFRFEISDPSTVDGGSGKISTLSRDPSAVSIYNRTPHSGREQPGTPSSAMKDSKAESTVESGPSNKSFISLPKYFEHIFRPSEPQTPTNDVRHAVRRSISERFTRGSTSRASSNNSSPERSGPRTSTAPGTPSSELGRSGSSNKHAAYFEDSQTEVFENGQSAKSKSSAATPTPFDMLNSDNMDNVTVNFGAVASGSLTPPALRRVASVRSFRSVRIPRINWDDLEVNSSVVDIASTADNSGKNKSGKSVTEVDPVIGKGSFGSVIRAILHHEDVSASGGVEVVIKVMTKSVSLSSRNLIQDANKDKDKDKDKILRAAISEVSTIIDAESRINYKDCITKIYGICEGPLPEALCRALRVLKAFDAVGIVMRYEGGGTLHALVHAKNLDQRPTVIEKLRLLTGIARALAELHTAGVVHGDIKPENVLLSSINNSSSNPDAVSEIRLADFGLSYIRDENSASTSAIRETANFRGTPLYAAPEMLVNPYSDEVDGKLARASRRTDMYAFAILSWEVLTSSKPFSEISNSTLLASKVHQGFRPSLDALPKEVPAKIVQMIQACWDADRDKRKTAIECYSILKRYYENMSKTPIDVYLTTFKGDTTIAPCVLKFLQENDVNVHFGDVVLSPSNTQDSVVGSSISFSSASPSLFVTPPSTLPPPTTPSSSSSLLTSTTSRYPEVARSKVVVAVITQSFQEEHSDSMMQLKEARKANRSIIPLFLEPNYQSWHSQDLVYYCQLRSSSLIHFDLSDCVAGIDTVNIGSCISNRASAPTSGQWELVNSAKATFESEMQRLLVHIKNLEV